MDLRARFGFHQTPFTREIRIDHRFRLPATDDALDAVAATVEQRLSAALIAPAGTGKTAILRALVARLPEARYRCHYVKVTGLSKRDMCREIATAIGAPPAGAFPFLLRRIQERFTQDTETDGVRPVLLLDEAHELRPDVLAMLRVLTNFDMDSRLVLSLVLAGQAPLAALLRRDELEDVARRISHYATLRLLSRDEMGRYVEHRCTVAGAVNVPFDAAAMDALYELGRGNLRATDALALKALELAHRQGRDVVDAAPVLEARKCLWA